jgi:putative ABC transport system permease protein
MVWAYLIHHKRKSVLLVAAAAIVLYVPAGLDVVVRQSEEDLTARAGATPLLIGAKGSQLELVLNSLYLSSEPPNPTAYRELRRAQESGLATAVPMYVRFRAGTVPIVGTSFDYFDRRGLSIGSGRLPAMLGECVVGARAAERLGVTAGDHVVSSPESVFDLAGVYPLRMPVTGVLAPSASPDDHALFVDVKTAWVIEGLSHGHQDLAKPEAASGVLKREDDVIVANASVVQYNEITPDNVDSFHFHGDPGDFPITAVIAFPHDDKSDALLRGRYLSEDESVQVVQPIAVVTDLLDTIFTVQRYVLVGALITGVCTLAVIALVFLLSLRLRQREMETMHRIGGSRAYVGAILAGEIVFVLAIGSGLAAALTAVTAWAGPVLLRAIVGS